MTYTDDMRRRVRDYDRERGIYVVSCAAPEEKESEKKQWFEAAN